MTRLNIYLNFPGNTEEVFNFYKSIFGGEFGSIIRYKDMPMSGVERSTSDENKILNINYALNQNDVLMGSDMSALQGKELIKGNNIYLTISPDSKKEADRIFKALSEGGMVETPMSDQPWKAYYGSLKDKYGMWWSINYMYTPEELKNEPVGARAARNM